MILEPVLETASRQPDKPAVGDPTLRLTYGQLVRLAGAYREVVCEGTGLDRVGLLLPSGAVTAAALLGGLWAGKTVVPLNFLLPPAELGAVLADAGLDLIITTEAFRERVGSLPQRLVFVEQVRPGGAGRLPDPPPVGPDDVAVILYTSGTSGLPKGVMLTYGNLRSNSDACIAHARMDPEQRLLGVLPVFHSFGLTALTVVPLVLGATTYYLPRFQATGVLEAIRREGISIFMAVPSMYGALLRVREARGEDLGSLYLAIAGGEPLPLPLYEAFRERFGVAIMEGYGMTETGPVVSINMPWAHRPGTVGRPIPGTEVRIAEAGEDGVGEILVRGPGVMKGYYNRPEETAAVLERDGWLHTGDLGAVEDGFVRICGRAKELIIVGGDNVYPAEVENVLLSHPAVGEAAVVGRSHPVRGEVVVAYVILREGQQASETELREFCRDRLAGYKVPREIIVAEDLPRGPTGKILKRALMAGGGGPGGGGR